uniref:Contactin-associated protein 1-like n=1 Tax=Sinocyclocheilus rhinocerous TaxID=307959 RepID=A0A673JQT8_9TELE
SQRAVKVPLKPSTFPSSTCIDLLLVIIYATCATAVWSSGWSPSPRDRQPWMQIDLGRKYRIMAIATQGTFNSYDWVTKYMLLYGDRFDAWTPYVMRGGNMTLPGNWNYYQVKRNVFHYAFTAKHLRIYPMGWNTENGGKIGLRVELYGCPYDSYVMQFEGDDMVAYSFPRGRMRTLQDHYALNFKTLEKDGVLLHSEGLQGDSITLELKTGCLYLHISLGSSTVHNTDGMTTMMLGNLLDTQHWHYVTIKRYGREVNFTLDSQTETAILNGEFQYLDLDKQIYVGGVIEKDMPHLPGKVNFRGCMENVFINGINIIYRTQYQEPEIRLAPKKVCRVFLIFTQQQEWPNNYLQLPGFFRKNRLAVKFKFRSWDYTGLLMFTRFADELGSLELGLSEGQVNITLMQLYTVNIILFCLVSGYRLNDGFWHTVDLTAKDKLLTITIDEDESSPLKITNPFTVRTGDRYFFGGCPKTNNTARCVTKLSRFHGCMQQIFIDDEPVDIDVMLQRKWGRYAEILLGTCGITDRCSPNPCEHEGRCIQSWNDFLCVCNNTGYKGEVCHNSVYRESCEAYRLNGKYWSGNYTIDPDLSGPLKPFTVYCNMLQKSWTVTEHNRMKSTKVSGSTMDRPYIGDLQYVNASWDEVTALANTSLYCEQWIEFSCYKSRLLNTPRKLLDGRPYTFWIGQHNESHEYWGGAFPESGKCGCAVNQTCTDSKYWCNCDADYRQWHSDKGYLSFRDHLPVRRIVIGDTNRTGSEVRYSVGALYCHGDRSIWNTIAFTKPTYLAFPTFKPGTSADITFHFRTYRTNGVFVESSDDHLRNFLRIELNSTTEVVFIFMVGDGIRNVTLRSPKPLNDNEWHYVEAEINVKLARLKVDFQPPLIPKHTMHLYSGAANHTLRPFLGCLRGLRMNGVPVDLEGKVDERAGIRRNCTGACLNASIPCRNGGQCIDGYASYTCDCNNTAFDGYYCHLGELTHICICSLTLSLPHWHNFTLGYNTTTDDIEFSFSTLQAPAVLLYISSFSNDYIAVLLKKDGTLSLRYRLGIISYKFKLTDRNMADGFPHFVNITRHNYTIWTQVGSQTRSMFSIPRFDSPKSIFLGRVMEVGGVDYEIQRHNSPGFMGCISGVRYNIFAPLKAYFRPNVTNPPVTTQGYVVESNCGAFPPVLGYVPWEDDPWFTGLCKIHILTFTRMPSNIHYHSNYFCLFVCFLKEINTFILQGCIKSIKISILESFLKDHVTLKTGVMMLKIQICITAINCILKYIIIVSSYFKLYLYFTILLFFLL